MGDSTNRVYGILMWDQGERIMGGGRSSIGASNLAQPLFSIGPMKENSIFAKLIIGQKSNHIIMRILLIEDPLYIANPILKIFDSKYTH